MVPNTSNIQNVWVTSGFIYLFIVAILGIIMRSSIFFPSIIPFENILHAHSHTALLGWAFVMATTEILKNSQLSFKKYKWFLVVFSISIIGMLITFLYQSYGVYSITFSSLFIFTSYIFLLKVYKKIKKDSVASRLYSWAIIWFFISTLGIGAIGPTVAILGKEDDFYQLAIHFFLHFQINGWLLYAAIATLYKSYKSTKLIDSKLILWLNLSLVLSFSLNIYWVTENLIWHIISCIGLIIQAIVFYKIASNLSLNLEEKIKGYKLKIFYLIIIILLVTKPILQLIGLVPNWALSLEYNKFWIIAFLHLVLIGIVSFSFIYSAIIKKIIPNKSLTYWGITLWIIGFIITETVIALQGLGINSYVFYHLLLYFSIMMCVGIGIILYLRLQISFFDNGITTPNK